MRIVHKNPEVNTADSKPVILHTCNVCGTQNVWSEGWRWKWLIIGKGAGAWEYEFKVCSDECLKKDENENLAEKKRKELNR